MLIGHSIAYVAARVVAGILGIVTTGVLTRLLGPADYGLYSFALVVMYLVSQMLFDWLGITYLRLAGGRSSDPEIFAHFIRLYIAMVAGSGCAIALAWAAGWLGHQPAPYLIGVFLAWAYSWVELLSQHQVAALHPGRYLAVTLSRAALILGGAGGAAWLTRDANWAAGCTGLAIWCSSLVGSQHIRWRLPNFNRALAKQALAFGFPVAITMGMLGVSNNGTRALLQLLGSNEMLGLYSAVFVLVQQSLVLIASGFGSAGYSLALRALENSDVPGARRQMANQVTLLIAILGPASLGMALTAQDLATLVLGQQYVTTAVQVAPWLATGAFFLSIRSFYFDLAFHLGKRPVLQTQVAVGAAVVAIVLGLVLIPKMGPLGAAIGVTASSVVSCLHSYIVGRGVFRLTLPVDAMLRIAACCAAMTLIVVSIPPNGVVAFILRVSLGTLAYGVAAVALDVLGVRTRLAAFLPAR